MWVALTVIAGQNIVTPATGRIATAVALERGDCPDTRHLHPLQGGATVHCTRTDPHKGRHLALSGYGIIAAWPGDHPPTLGDLR